MSNRTKRGLQSPVLNRMKESRPVPGSVAAKEADQPERKRVIVRPIVVRHLSENLGLPVHIDDMVKMTGADKSSVQAAMLVLLKEGKLNIDTVVGGNTWIYRGPTQQTVVAAASAPVAPAREVGSKQMYTELGEAKDGTKILEDEEGKLWRATEL